MLQLNISSNVKIVSNSLLVHTLIQVIAAVIKQLTGMCEQALGM